ncbi:hypothetical protein DJ78_16305 [Halorubrum ezzemoulense]|uniref:Glycosyltransferase family 1 protein n=2 Tax=Halorubrum ezzemoulense TaxID=337243 RepID=A0A256JER2_HALEZ|nr:hypothetical protein DJ78_16305 [Halorubrum ezzemoulense]
MEKYNRDLVRHLRDHCDVTLIANPAGNTYLPFFIVEAFLKTLVLSRKHDIEAVVISDASLSPLGYLIKRSLSIPTIVAVHGLDVTFDNWFYQRLIPPLAAKMDRIICNSGATVEACERHGVPTDRTVVIPPGINPDEFYSEDFGRDEMEQVVAEQVDIDLEGKTALLSVGRIIERKGHHWFISEVLPRLGDDYVYLVAGDGEFVDRIKTEIAVNELEDRVAMLGYVSDKNLKKLYNGCDLLVMPNVPVEGDMEGFGMVNTEAASCGLPVVASDIGGISDAVIPQQTGLLVQQDTAKFVDAIKDADFDSDGVRRHVLENYSWEVTAQQFASEIQEVIEAKK